MSEERAIRDFLGDRPTSEELREWRAMLEERRHALCRELALAEAAERDALRRRLAQLEKTIAGLREEEEITRFVEDSVRVTLAMGATVEMAPEDRE